MHSKNHVKREHMCAFVVRPHGEKPQDQGCVSPHSNLMPEYVTKGKKLVMFGNKIPNTCVGSNKY